MIRGRQHDLDTGSGTKCKLGFICDDKKYELNYIIFVLSSSYRATILIYCVVFPSMLGPVAGAETSSMISKFVLE